MRPRLSLKPRCHCMKEQNPPWPAAADDEGSSGDEGAPRAGETFAGPQAGRGMGSTVKAAALQLLEGGCCWGSGCWAGARVCQPGQRTLGATCCNLGPAAATCQTPPPASPAGGGGEEGAPTKGLFALPFMQRALERKKLEAQQAAQQVGDERSGAQQRGTAAALQLPHAAVLCWFACRASRA